MSPSDGLRELLAGLACSLGYVVRRRERTVGVSGVEHVFDLVIEDPRSKRRVAITVTDTIDYEHVMLLLACRMDVDAQHVVIAKTVNPVVLSLLEGTNVKVVVEPSLGVTIASGSQYGRSPDKRKALANFLRELLSAGTPS